MWVKTPATVSTTTTILSPLLSANRW
jgi:hypothetical protein